MLAPQIRQAYRSRATKEHPDKGGDQVKFMAVQKAYDVLVDDNKRRMYDATGQVERSAEEDLLDAFGGGASRSAPPALLRWLAVRAQGAAAGTRRDSSAAGSHNAAAARPDSRAGTFKENMRAAEAERANQNESITLAETKDMQSHTYLFEAWTRARGEGKARRAPRCATVTTQPAAHKPSYAQVYDREAVIEDYGVEKSSYEAKPLPKIKAYQVRAGLQMQAAWAAR